ncbi:hypothetical protein pb186bvf_012887 [Paramecium bursaria]
MKDIQYRFFVIKCKLTRQIKLLGKEQMDKLQNIQQNGLVRRTWIGLEQQIYKEIQNMLMIMSLLFVIRKQELTKIKS